LRDIEGIFKNDIYVCARARACYKEKKRNKLAFSKRRKHSTRRRKTNSSKEKFSI
jgi:hypothetical protein